MKNVIAYIRVSTDGQVGDDKFGLEAQKQQITEYCYKNNLTILEWVADEGESGAKERPGFDRIVYGEVSNPPAEAVVVAKTDRVARDINVYFYYKMMLMKKNITLISITEDFGSFGVFSNVLEAFTLCIAQMERENIMKRTAGGRFIKAGKGGFSGGVPPYGYKTSNGRLLIDPEEAEIVRKIFDLRSTGSSYMAIADKLNDLGYHPRRGEKFIFSTVQAIVKNKPTYMGYYHYGEAPCWTKGAQDPLLPDDGTIIPGETLFKGRRKGNED